MHNHLHVISKNIIYIYIESLTLRSFLSVITSALYKKQYYNDKSLIFYYIHASKNGVLVANLFSKFFGYKFNESFLSKGFEPSTFGSTVRISGL